jgi:hypothetical protein
LEGDFELDAVSDFRWKYRLIIVFSQGSDTLAIEILLAREKELIVERDILWFVVTRNSVSSNYSECVNETLASSMRDQFQSEQSTDIDVVLVGKDGKIKHRANSLDTIDLYFRIDQMPMRQSELKSKG